MLFNALDILYLVLAIILIPIGTLLSMVLYRAYHMLDRVDRILSIVDRIANYTFKLEKLPMMLIEKLMGK